MNDITIINMHVRRKSENDLMDAAVPLGPLYLTAVLEERGYRVDFRDYQLNNFHQPLQIESFLSFIDNSASIVGVSCMYDLLPFVIIAMQRLKELYPEKTIILGGPGPSGVAEKILERFKCIDIVVIGEGEKTIVELLDRIPRDLARVSGISYRAGDRVYTNPPRQRVENLDELPFPAYHRIDFEHYPYASIMTSRGCPYNCVFCDVAPLWRHQICVRSIENVIEEIILLAQKYQRKRIHIVDDTFVLSIDRVMSFCHRLKEQHLQVEWGCFGRIGLMDDELMEVMSDSGCRYIYYGVESGSNEVLKRLKKGFTTTQAMQDISSSLKYFESVYLSFIWGFPFEHIEDFRKTINFMLFAAKMGATVQFHLIAPLPLSQLYDDYKQELMWSDLFWDNVIALNRRKLPEEMKTLIKVNPDIFPGFYIFKSANITQKARIAEKLGLFDNSVKNEFKSNITP